MVSEKKKMLLLLLLFIISTAATSETYDIKPNLAIIDSIVSEIMHSQFQKIGNDNGDSLAIDIANLGIDKENYLRVIIGNLALEKSFKVIRNYNPSSSFQGLVLTVDRFDVDIEYSKPYEKSLLGNSYVRRQITTKMRGQLYSKRSKLVLSGIDKNTKSIDEIPYSDITRIEDKTYNFSHGVRTDYTFWDKVFEPVIIVSAVTIIIYLFYSQRT